MNRETINLAQKRFIVSIYEIHQHFVSAEEFSGNYTKTVSLSDGTTRTVELTPTILAGNPAMEFNDTGHRTYMGMLPVRTGGHINGKLMVKVFDLDDVLTSPVLPPATSMTSLPEFVPAGFAQGIEILNDDMTPMGFVVEVLGTHLGLSPQEASHTMFAIHRQGGTLIPTPSLADAQRIAAQITAEAARNNHPLVCRAVSISP